MEIGFHARWGKGKEWAKRETVQSISGEREGGERECVCVCVFLCWKRQTYSRFVSLKSTQNEMKDDELLACVR